MASAQTPDKHSALTLMTMQFAAGGCAGFVEVSIMHPLDLIKTRFQIQGGLDDPQRYNSIADCVKKMYRSEGALSFYKGILPPLMAETPKRAVKFFTFERYKNMFSYGNYLNQPVDDISGGELKKMFNSVSEKYHSRPQESK